jgi:hypothetical protein
MIRRLLSLLIGMTLAARAADVPSFEELKETGARQSKFRKQTIPIDSPAAPQPALSQFHKTIGPILKKHCVSCHGPEKAKARLRIDTLDPNLLRGSDVDWWLEIHAVLGNGEMPPPEKSELSADDRTKAIDWLSGEIRMASTARRAEAGHSSFRRMTRYEYNYALQDLIGVAGDFARDLPPEAHSEDGFQNSSETLHMSVSQLETYRRIARKALLRATVRGDRPPVLYWGVTMEQASRIDWEKQKGKLGTKRHRSAYFKELSSGLTARHTWAYSKAAYAHKPTDTRPEVPEAFDRVAIVPEGDTLIVELGEKVPDEGVMRVRVRAARTSMDDRVPSLQLEFGWKASNEGRARLRVSEEDLPITALPDQPEFYEFNVPLADIYPRNSVRKTSPLGQMPNPSEYIRFVNSSASRGDIQIDYVEVATPVYDQWPPESHQRIFLSTEAREVLNTFMSRAWRRTVTSEELDQKLRLFQTMRQSCDTFEEAMVEVLATVLAAPDFLYLRPDEIASRLSMFLWSSVPDDRLLKLAGNGELVGADVLAGEVKRMLADPRAKRFAKHFVHQWLDLQLLDFLKPDEDLRLRVKEAMQLEPVRFFQAMLGGNESVLNFIHADYTMANERLAEHYGLSGVSGNHFRRVQLDAGPRRGGLLTQAGLLAMNSSGEHSNSLKRGIWMLESLLNDPPPPPPPAVPEIDLADPKIAKMTLKERIEDHRNHPACMACHVKIDPWGIAFENYDARGQWRDHIQGKPVDATSRLFNNQPLKGMDGLKRFLLQNRQDQFVQALVHKMTVYALGRPLTFADRADIEEITGKVRRQDDGLATLVRQVVTSELFRSK